MYPPVQPYETGRLRVSDIHELYYDVCGNSEGTPVLFLHVGPGVGVGMVDRSHFNPEKYKIIFFDQRGSGKSTPKGCLEENTTWDLVNDIEKLREWLKVDQWHVFGGSWGSTLSLVYAQAHPNRVKSMVMWGIFASRASELSFIYQNGASHVFPEAWEGFVSLFPEAERNDLLVAYHTRINSPDHQTRLTAAKSWAKWESVTSKFYGNTSRVNPAKGQHEQDEGSLIDIARIQTHYFLNKSFLRDGQILEEQEIDKIRHIPTIAVQGSLTLRMPSKSISGTRRTFKVWPEITLHIVSDAGHTWVNSDVQKLLVEATDKFADM